MNSNAVSNSDKVGFKSQIPVLKSRIPIQNTNSRIPIPAIYPTSQKCKYNASSLQKPSCLPHKNTKPFSLNRIPNTVLNKNNKLHMKSGLDKNCLKKIRTKETKENNPLPDYFASQKDEKFEVNEFNRNMILSGKEISPNTLKLQSGFKLSSNFGKRSSIYQKIVVPADPFKEALKAIKNANLSVKENKKTPLMRESNVQSPYRDYNSFYTPRSNPENEALRSLEVFKLKLLQEKTTKSVKKVRFNMNVQECIPMDRPDIDVTPFKTTELQLTQINEKSEENTPNYPESEMIECLSINDSNSTASQFVNGIKEISKSPYSHQFDSEFSSPTCNNKTTHDTTIQYVNPMKFQTLSLKNEEKVNMEVPQKRIYTPQPFSIYSKSSEIDISTPEFITKGLKNLSPPIETPLVLKSLAKSTTLSPEADLSPIRLKLNFTEDQNTPIKEGVTKTNTSVAIDKIITTQKLLDELADEECHTFLANENLPVVCNRYLQNPIASTLTEGDDMHFIPIKN